MLKKVEEFLENLEIPEQKKPDALSLDNLLHATMGYYHHDKDIPPIKVVNFEDALAQMKNLSGPIGNKTDVGLVKGALEHSEGKTFKEVSELRRYIRRGQYVELLWMATCIFLAEDVKQLESMTQECELLGQPGIYKIWKERKEEIKNRE